MGDSCHPPYKHHREHLTDFFQTTSIWRKLSFGRMTVFEPSAFSSPRGRARVGPTLKSGGADSRALPKLFSLYSLMPTCQKLRVLILRFLKKPLGPDWTGRSISVLLLDDSMMEQAKTVNTDHDRWKVNERRQNTLLLPTVGECSSFAE